MILQYKYGLLTLVRNKQFLFWNLMFPLILGTLFFIAFGNIAKKSTSWEPILVAIVNSDTAEASNFMKMIKSLSQGKKALLAPINVTSLDSERLLQTNEVLGTFYIEKEIRLKVLENGISQSILKNISDSYLQMEAIISNVSPDQIPQAIADFSHDLRVNSEFTLGKGEIDNTLVYYYAALAMTCLFGSFLGNVKLASILANLSALSARRAVSPSKKSVMLFADISAAVTVLFTVLLIVISYYTFALGINLGKNIAPVILASFVGSITGVCFGVFITAVICAERKIVEGILTGVSLFLCFLSGLMFGDMKSIIETHAPIINRLNPAALLSDLFYSLAVYDDYSVFIQRLSILLSITFLFFGFSILVVRRKKYDSL